MTGGLLDLVIELSQNSGPTLPTTSTSVASSGTTNFLPDYADFLSWLGSVSSPFNGKVLDILLETEFTPFAVQQRSQDFLTASKITNQYSLEPYSLQLADVSLMVSTSSSTYDVFGVDNQNVGSFNRALIPIQELVQTYPDLTYPGLDLADFSKFNWDTLSQYPPNPTAPSGGNAAGAYLLPFDIPIMMQFFRKDIYDTLGIALPNTWDEYYEDLLTIENSGMAPFGAVSQAAADLPIIYEYLVHLASFGGQLWQINGNNLVPAMNSDSAVAALENFVRMRPHSDPSSFTYYWSDSFSSLASETAATGLLWHDYLDWFNDPARSLVVGKMSVKRNPAGPTGSFSTFGGSGAGVSRFSKNPKAAWLWLQWATAKGTQETMLMDKYHVLPTRDSVFTAPPVAQALTSDAYLVPKLAKSIFDSGGLVALTPFPKWYKISLDLAFYLNQAWVGKLQPRDALNQAVTKINSYGSLTFA